MNKPQVPNFKPQIPSSKPKIPRVAFLGLEIWGLGLGAYFLLFLIPLFIAACNWNHFFYGEDEDPSCKNPSTGYEPKKSELAVLMRAMQGNAQLLREQIGKGKIEGEIPFGFEKIYRAIPTDSTVSGELFNKHSGIYLESLNNLYSGGETDAVTGYNLLIKSCIDCHKQFCPGPIKMLKKLKI